MSKHRLDHPLTASRPRQSEAIALQAQRIAQSEGRTTVTMLDRIRAARALFLPADEF
jgi:hypothetical protein